MTEVDGGGVVGLKRRTCLGTELWCGENCRQKNRKTQNADGDPRGCDGTPEAIVASSVRRPFHLNNLTRNQAIADTTCRNVRFIHAVLKLPDPLWLALRISLRRFLPARVILGLSGAGVESGEAAVGVGRDFEVSAVGSALQIGD